MSPPVKPKEKQVAAQGRNQIQDQTIPLPDMRSDKSSKKVDAVHIEKEMKEISVEKSGGQGLPDPEILFAAEHLQIRSSAVKKEEDNIDQDQIPDH
jgi:hypothetical protein